MVAHDTGYDLTTGNIMYFFEIQYLVGWKIPRRFGELFSNHSFERSFWL
jgi:hypothetical protein